MSHITNRQHLKNMLEDLKKEDFHKFCHQLLDRRDEPRVRRNRVEGKGFLDITDVLVSTFTESGAVDVAVEILRQIGCNDDADRLVKDTCGQSSKPVSGSTASPSGGNKMETDKHFVDKHKVQLIKRVSNIGPILDELFDHDVVQQECYDKIRALATSQEKIRELYCGPLKAAGVKGKDVFYKLLEEHESYLIDDLKKNN
ncbi:hypothetical protein PAMA_015495 [Pampus argenteus]